MQFDIYIYNFQNGVSHNIKYNLDFCATYPNKLNDLKRTR